MDADRLCEFVARQVGTFFPDRVISPDELRSPMNGALARHAHAYRSTSIKGASTSPNPFHTDQWAAFLYLLSNELFRQGSADLAGKAYALNKALHALDVFYEVALPEVFAFQHPVGTVLGRGTYSNYLFVYQRCSVGSNLDGTYPTIGEGVVMFGGSSIIGRSIVGPNSWLSVGATVMDEDIPGDCVVFGRSPNLTIKSTRRNVRRDIFEKS